MPQQKGVITILIDAARPRVGNFVPELIIGSSSIVERTTPSQVIEAAASMWAMEYKNHMSLTLPM